MAANFSKALNPQPQSARSTSSTRHTFPDAGRDRTADPSHFLDHVEICDQHFIFVAGGLGDDFAAPIAEVTFAIKLTDILRLFPAHAVDRTDQVAIGRGVRRLLEFPKILREAGNIRG